MNSAKQKLINQFYPKNKTHPFPQILSLLTQKGNLVLDAGCGNGKSFNYNIEGETRKTVGIDLRIQDLVENSNIQYPSASSLENLPFRSQSFDVIFSRDVFEHLQSPGIVLQEFSRVLKPGGSLVLQTPNNYHYFALFGHLVPHSFQRLLARHILKNQDEVFRTYYRCNSKKQIMKLGKEAGFLHIDVLYFEPRPSYMAFSPLAFLPAVAYERLVTHFSLLSHFSAQIIAILNKGM